MAKYLIITTEDEDQRMKDLLEEMGEETGSRSGMRMGGSSGSRGSRGGYRRDSRGYPMDVTNLRRGSRGYHDKEQEVEALEEQIMELKMRKKQLESEEEGMRYGMGGGAYPYSY